MKNKYKNIRMKLKATIDGRERTQSRIMDGFISTANGLYMYPDGKYYKLGTAPAQWCINDRETQYIVFLNDEELKNERKRLQEQAQKVTAVK